MNSTLITEVLTKNNISLRKAVKLNDFVKVKNEYFNLKWKEICHCAVECKEIEECELWVSLFEAYKDDIQLEKLQETLYSYCEYDEEAQEAESLIIAFQEALENIENDNKEFFESIVIDGKCVLDYTYEEFLEKKEEKLKKLIFLTEECIKLLPPPFQSIIEHIEMSIGDKTNSIKDIPSTILSHKILSNKAVYLAYQSSCAYNFVYSFIEILFEENELQSLINGYKKDYIDDGSREFLLKTLEYVFDNFDFDAHIIFDNIDEDYLEKVRNTFFSSYEQEFVPLILDFIESNRTNFDDDDDYFMLDFSNTITFALMDLLNNAFIKSDEDLKSALLKEDFKVSDLLADISAKLNENEYNKIDKHMLELYKN